MTGIEPASNPVLRAPCCDVTDFDEFQAIADRLYGAAKHDGRAGVAAPQIGVSLRAFAVMLGGTCYPRVIVNPRITARWGSYVTREGCLSLDGQLFLVARSTLVNVSAQDRRGNLIELVCSGFDARLLQHEIDHLDGILVSDRTQELAEWQAA